MSSFKPQLNISDVNNLLTDYFGCEIQDLKPVAEGQIKQVFFFQNEGHHYVIRFSDNMEGFQVERYLYKQFASQGVLIPRIILIGSFQYYYFSISERAMTSTLMGYKPDKISLQLPDIIDFVTKIHRSDISHTTGYGWLHPSGNGNYSIWEDYIEAFFSENQVGFWKDWYELFESTFLDRNIFQKLYNKMMMLSKYSSNQRFLVHGDCHFGNIVSDGSKITGIIDWGNVVYGDFLQDIANMHMWHSQFDFPKLFQKHYETLGISIPNFEERFICVTFLEGLDALRFFAKQGNQSGYEFILNYLLSFEV